MEQFAAIIERIEQGESVRSICDRPGWPTRNGFRRFIAADRAAFERYETALATGKAFRRRPKPTPQVATKPCVTADQIARVIAAVDRGTLLKEACEAAGLKVAAFQFKVLRQPALRARWLEAKQLATAARLCAGTLQHVDKILNLIESGMSLRAAIASDAAFPDKSKFLNALDTDADLRWRYDEAIAANREDIARRARRRRLALTSFTGLDLADQVDKALPKKTDPDIRKEVVAEVVAAALGGDISHRDVGQEARRLARKATNQLFRPEHASLDMPLGPDSSATLGDLLSNWDS